MYTKTIAIIEDHEPIFKTNYYRIGGN